MLKRLFLVNIALVLSLAALSNPARPGRIYLSQPDGNGFYALFYGDEMVRIKVTETGNAIVQEDDGWWCYAVYDGMGHKVSTGFRVGDDAPSDILQRSRDIPYNTIISASLDRRSEVRAAEEAERGILSRISGKSLTRTGSPAVKYGLVILAEFKGEKERFTYKKEDFVRMLTSEGYSDFGATGSAKEYFDSQFNGMYEFHFDVTDVVTLDKEMAYYGRNKNDGQDENPHLMIMEACQLVDPDVDFRRYDQDGDGEVDNVFLFFAGQDEAEGASENHIWSHAWYIRDGAGRNLVLDGVRINRYACTSELRVQSMEEPVMAAIGTFCHEYSHTFGLPDLYDTDYQVGGYSASTWRRLSLMDGGNYNNNGNTPPNYNAIEREILMMTGPELLETPGPYSLDPITKGRYFRLDTDNQGEYFLLECRSAEGWDRHIGGSGLVVYHIDRSMNPAGYSEVYDRDVTAAERWGNCNEVNALASHQCADLIEADGRMDSYTSIHDETYKNYMQSLSGLFFPYGGVTALTPTSKPGLGLWGDAKVDKAVTDISYSGGRATFNLVGFSAGALPIPVDVKPDVFQDAAIISFSSSYLYSGTARIVCELAGETVQTVDVMSYEPGKWAYTFEGLDYSKSYTVHINFVDGDYIGEKTKLSFMTKRKQSTGYPYIYLANVDRTDGGLFPAGTRLPLRVFNASDAREIRWTFDGRPVTVGEDCYFEVRHGGVLKVHIIWEDGSEETIMKEINLEEVYED